MTTILKRDIDIIGEQILTVQSLQLWWILKETRWNIKVFIRDIIEKANITGDTCTFIMFPQKVTYLFQ